MAINYDKDSGLSTIFSGLNKKPFEIDEKTKNIFNDIANIPKENLAENNWNDFIAYYEITDDNLKEFLTTASPDKLNTEGYKEWAKDVKGLGDQFSFASVKAKGLQIASLGVNMMLGALVGFAANAAISWIDDAIHKEERLAEAAKEAEQNINDRKKAFDDTKKSANQIAREFAELSQGVNQMTGENATLSTEDYERFLELSNQLVETLPNIGYTVDENGNKIANMSGDVDTITDSINNLVLAEQRLVNQEISENMDKVFENAYGKLENASNKFEEVKEQYSSINPDTMSTDVTDKVNTLLSGGSIELSNTNALDFEIIKELTTLFDNAGLDFEGMGSTYYLSKSSLDSLKDFDEGELDKIQEDAASIDDLFADEVKNYAAHIDSYKDTVDSTNNDLSKILTDWLMTNEDYTEGIIGKFGSGYGAAIQQSIQAIDWSELIKENDWTDANFASNAQDYVTKNIIEPLKDIDNDKIRNAYLQIFTNPDLSTEQFQDFLQQLKDYYEENELELPVIFTEKEEKSDAINKSFDKRVNELAQGKGLRSGTDVAHDRAKLQDFFTEQGINSDAEKDYFLSVTKGANDASEAIRMYIDALTNADEAGPTLTFRQAWTALDNPEDETLKNTKASLLALAESGELTVENFHKTEGADTFLKQIGLSAEEAIKKINELVNHTDKLSAMKTGISSLSSILSQKKSNAGSKSTRNTGIGADTLSGLDDSFKDLDSWEEYERTMTDGTSSVEDCRKATNALATEWISSREFLSKLTSGTKKQNEAYKESYISMLKNMGIKNAEALVTRLLAEEEARAAAEKKWNKAATISLSDATAEYINDLANEKNWSEQTREALYRLALQKQIANGITLNTTDDIANMQALVRGITGASTALDAYQQLVANSDGSNVKELHAAWVEAQKEIKAATKESKTKVKVKSSSALNENPSDANSTKKSTQQIDWISRKLDILQKKLSATQAEYDKLVNPKEKSNNLAKQIKQLTALQNASTEAAKKYKKYADKSGLSDSLKAKVQSGDYNIGDYDDDTAEKINKYQEYYDKYLESRQKADEYEAQVRRKQEEKYQLKVDDAQAKIDKSNAIIDLNSGNYQKQNRQLDKQAKYLKESYKYQIKIAKLNGENIKAKQLETELEKELCSIEKQKFDNIQNHYSNKISLLEMDESRLSDEAALLEAKGATVTADMYTDQIKNQEAIRKKYVQERKKLLKQLLKMEEGTEEWYEARKALDEVDKGIRSCDLSIVGMYNNITNLADNVHKNLLNEFSSVTDEAEWLANLMSNKEMFDADTGAMTDEGIATLGAYAAGYEVSKQSADKEHAMLTSLQDAYKTAQSFDFTSGNVFKMKDSNGVERTYQSLKELQADIDETYSGWRENITKTSDYQNKIIDMMKEKLQSELDMIKKNIDAKKKALQAEKDLHDYQKTIQNSTKNISSLQKQIAALEGDNSEETMARMQKLQKELSDAQEDLNETEYNRYISDQQNMLDKLAAEYENVLTKEMNDTQKLLEDGTKLVNNSLGRIDQTNKEYYAKYGYTPEHISNMYNNTGTINANVKQIIDEITKKNTSTENESKPKSTANKVVSGIVSNVTGSQALGNVAGALADKVTGIVGNVMTQVSTKDKAQDYINKHLSKGKKEQKEYSAINKKLYSATNGMVLSSDDLKELAKIVGVEYDNASADGSLYKKLQQLGIMGFSSGGIVSEMKRFAQNHGESGWALVRKGEGILTPEMADTFTYDLVPRMDDIINASKVLADIPAMTESANTGNIEANFAFNLENVRDANDLIQQIQTNQNVRKAMQEVTIKQLTGSGTRLSVNNYH